MISRRTFILSAGAAALAPFAGPLLSSGDGVTVALAGPDSLDLIKQKYPFASTAKLKLAGWDEFLESENPASEPCQWVHVSSSWRVG